MSKQLLIYEKAVALSKEKHSKWSVEVGDSFAFAAQVNSVPLMAAEFGAAAADYSIVFVRGEDETYVPTVVLGLQQNQNVFVDDQQHWTASYIPAFVRRYPFVFALSEDKKTFTLCIDEAFAGFNQSNRGQKLFEKNGEPSKYVGDLLRFLQDFESEFVKTRSFTANLDELELLEPMHAQISSQTGEKTTLTGFYCVNREKLRNLSGKSLARLSATGELELAYLHLFSLKNFQELQRRSAQLPNEREAVAQG
ncbi:SapC family protein [bacterium]|nr:SapC family protein [bacterium]